MIRHAYVREQEDTGISGIHADSTARAAARRDADPERTKQITRQWAERNKERRAELQRNRRRDPGVYQSELEANAAARRVKRSLSRAGLPPKLLHATTAAERRANEREADAYFNDPSRPEHLRQFTVFVESLTEHMLKNGARMREFAEAYVSSRDRVGLPPVAVDDVVYARAVEIVAERMRRVDLLTSRDVAAAVRSTKAAVGREEQRRQFENFMKMVVTDVGRNRERYHSDAEFENRARANRGLTRAPIESLIVRLALQNVVQRVPRICSRPTTLGRLPASLSFTLQRRPTRQRRRSTIGFTDGRSGKYCGLCTCIHRKRSGMKHGRVHFGISESCLANWL
ncbi:hypothetical protein [Cryobacterium sp. PH31-L1]|uniref:hypothetical protein n=1 Tax=Cryobacterium sp. PH31-L1 TaxID=3046199 RepID=UPI0024BA5D85|nr:hypothetical protein [Cryobacterium sp. PH31-L1]MDJ0378504.1 hypothetical protein [Cryobacterium sp. PH31-L1]